MSNKATKCINLVKDTLDILSCLNLPDDQTML